MQKQINTFKTSPEANLAWECLTTTGVNLFLTGKAGTGKTTFLKRLRELCPKRMVVVAPTGVAAINAGGVTIHSMFQMPFGPFIPGSKLKHDFTMRKEKINIIRTLDLLVIDEISMVRADLLDAIDAYLRFIRRNNTPFGGVQLLMIGDLQQLAPVVTDQERDIIFANYTSPYFFASKALAQTRYITIELQQVYRQTDTYFLSLLNSVRNGNLSQSIVDELNKRYIPEHEIKDDNGYIRLTTHNAQADSINTRKLKDIRGHERVYQCSVEGNFPEMSYPADQKLILKEGAQVMFLKNDPSGQHRYYNGRIGRVDSMEPDKVIVALDDGQRIEVFQEKWQNAKYVINPDTHEIDEQVEGSFTQIPLRLAWAITIHKSQGLTFDRAIIDAQSSFAHGQVYVALSRCRTLEGLILSSPISASSVMTDPNVSLFISQQLSSGIDSQGISSLKAEYARSLAMELMSFGELQRLSFMLERLFDEALYRQYPQALSEIKFYANCATTEVFQIAQRFSSVMPNDIMADAAFLERIANGAKYMCQKISSTYDCILTRSDVTLDNKEIKSRLDRYRADLEAEVNVKKKTLQAIVEQGFDTTIYLKAKTEAILETFKFDADRKPAKVKQSASAASPSDVKYPALYEKLRQWRKKKADEESKPAFMVLSNATLINIASLLPKDYEALSKIKGVGEKILFAYSDDILKITTKFAKQLAKQKE
ncbi:MAG: AAA family ATPase [Bacteroidia bacterium]|nr:AAA family ATPase [Bacteroidia bacterium]